MKSSFLEKFKRALVLLLTGAMIATSVPSTAFAATVADDDVIIEEAVDAVAEDAVVEEEVVAAEPSDVVEALGAEEPVDGADTVEADKDGEVRNLSIDVTGADLQAYDGGASGIALFYNSGSPVSNRIAATYGGSGTRTVTVKDSGAAYTGTGIEWSLKRVPAFDIATNVTTQNNAAVAYQHGTTGALTAYNTALATYISVNSDANKTELLEKKADLEALLADVTTESLATNQPGITAAPESAGSDTYKISWRGLNKVSDGWYVLEATDKDNEIISVYTPMFEIRVDPLTMKVGTGSDSNNQYWTGSAVASGTGATGAVAFASKKMGYKVYKNADEVPAGTKAETYITGQEVVISADNDQSYAVDDLDFYFTEATVAGSGTGAWTAAAEGDTPTTNFEILDSYYETESATGLSSADKLTLVIAPKEGLSAKDGSKTYSAYLHVKSPKALGKNEVLAKVQYTVTGNLEISAKVNGKDPATTYVAQGTVGNPDTDSATSFNYSSDVRGLYIESSGTYEKVTGNSAVSPSSVQYYHIADGTAAAYAISLGNKAVGETFSDIVITAAGGTTGLELSKSSAGVIRTGVSATSDASGTSMTISGTIAQADTESGIFSMHAEDDGNNSSTVWFSLGKADVKDLSIATDDGKKEYKYGNTTLDASNNLYTYSMATDVELDESTYGITITNPSSADLTIGLALNNDTNMTVKAFYTENGTEKNKSLTGASQAFPIAATTGTIKLVATPSANGANTEVQIRGTSITNTDIKLVFNRISNFEITKPSITLSSGNEIATDLAAGYVGLPYDPYQFEYTAAKNVENVKWSLGKLDEVTDSTRNTKLTTAIGGGILATTANLTETYGLTFSVDGKIEGTPKAIPAGGLFILAKATYKQGATTGLKEFRLVKIAISKPDVNKALTISSENGTNLTAIDTASDRVIDLGTLNTDDTAGASMTINLKNLLNVDIVNAAANGSAEDDGIHIAFSTTDANATKTTYPGGTKRTTNIGADISKYLKVKYSANAEAQGYFETNGMAIESEDTGVVTIESLVPAEQNGTTNLLTEGEYEAKLDVYGGSNANAAITTTKYPIIVKLKVEAKPVINVAAVESGTYTVDTVVNSGSGYAFTTASFNGITTWKYALAEGSTLPAGLTLNSQGVLGGKPTAAGEYKFTVTSTASTDSTVVGKSEVSITVLGTNTAAFKVDGSVVAPHYTYVMPGVVKGNTGDIEVSITNVGSVAASGLTVSIEDAPDDRWTGDSTTAAEILKHPDNPYDGSDAYFTVGTLDNTAPGANRDAKVTITTKDTAPAGEYKIKVKVKGNNVTETYFYVYLIVEDLLTIDDILSSNGVVGQKFYQPVTASGVDASKHAIHWAELEADGTTKITSATSAKKSVLLKTGGLGLSYVDSLNTAYINSDKQTSDYSTSYTGVAYNADVNGNITDIVTEMSGAPANGTTTANAYPYIVYVKDSSNKDTNVIDTAKSVFREGVPTKSGDYTVILQASTQKGNLASQTIKHAKDGDLSTAITASTSELVDNAAAYPAQKAIIRVPLSISKTSGVSVGKEIVKATGTNGEYRTTGWSAPYSNATGNSDTAGNVAGARYDIEEGIQSSEAWGSDGFKDVTGYVFQQRAAGYADGSQNTVTVTLESLALKSLAADVIISGTDANQFTFTGLGTNPITGETTRLTIPASSDGVTPGTAAFTVTPKNKLANKTYTANLSIEGEGFVSIPFGLSFDVQDATYHAEVEYIQTTGDNAALTTTTGYDKDVYTVLGSDEAAPTAGIELEAQIKNATPPTVTSSNDILYITNTGNTPLQNVRIEEFYQATGSTTWTKVNDTNEALQFSVGGASAKTSSQIIEISGIAANKGHTYVQVAPKSIATAGEFSREVRVSYKDASNVTKTIAIPVSFTVYDTNLTNIELTTPTSTADLGEIAEGYVPSTVTGGRFVVTNNKTTGAENTVVNLKVEVDNNSTNKFAFDIVYDGKTYSAVSGTPATVTIDKIDPNETATFDVVPANGLPFAEYEATIKISAGSGSNLKSDKALTEDVKVKVTQSTAFTADVYATGSAPSNAKVIDGAFAQRLYNSVMNTGASNQYIDSIDEASGTTQVITLDLDANGVGDATITFTGTLVDNSSAGIDDTLEDVDGVVILRDDSQSLSIDKQTITFNTTGLTANTYFATATLNLYSKVSLRAEYAQDEFITLTPDDLIAGKIELAQSDPAAPTDVTKNAVYVKDKGIIGVSTAASPLAANDAIYVYVPNGKSAASVFGGSLPKANRVNKTFSNWETISRDAITDGTIVTKNTVYVIQWHTHKYVTSWTEDADDDSTKNENVVWTWTVDSATGKRDASVTLKCVNNCLDADKAAVTLTTKADTSDDPTSLVKISGKEEVATCVKGARYEYTASVVYDGNTYKSTKSSDEGQPNGHDYTPSVTWAQNETSKAWEPTISLVCNNCDDETENHKPEVSGIVVTPSVVKEAKCTEKGETKYSVTSFVAAGKTYTPAEFSKYDKIAWEYDDKEVAPLGHEVSNAVYILDPKEEGVDQRTATGKIVCSRCGETIVAEGKVNVTLGKDAEGNEAYVGKVTGTDNKEYTIYAYDHTHTWSAPEWAWTPADEGIPTAAEATFTCTTGKETKTIAATITMTADGDYKDYTATVTFNGQDYTDVITLDKDNKRTTKHTDHEWTASIEWDEPKFNFDDPTVVIYYTCKYGETKIVTVDVTKSAPIVRKGVTYYELTLNTTDPSGKAVTDKKYVDSTGTYVNKSAIGPENPEFDATQVWNLFYTDNYQFEVDSDIEITGAFTGTDKGQFFTVSGEGGSYEVKYTGDAKKRKSAASKTTFSAPAKWSVDGEDVTGTFQITVPTEYVKPALKLSTAKANYYTVGEKEQKVSTTVMVQNEVGNYQSMNFDDYNIDVTDSKMFGYNGTAKFSETDSYPPYGNLVFTATGKSNGKITIQGENWVEPVALQFNVVEVKKHSLTVGNKNSYTLTMNSTTPALVSTIYPQMDGTWLSSFEDMPALTITAKVATGPKVTFDDTTGAIVITNADDDGKAIATKGSFTYEITDPNSSKLKLTVKVTDKALTAKNVKLKVKQKMNLITGQSLVLNTTLKDVNGYISSVELMDDPEKSKFEVYGGSNIYVTPKEGATMDTKTKETINLKITVSDGDNDVAIENVSFSFKAVATAPTFKVQKAFYTAQNNIVSVNFTSTYKNGAKHQVKLNPTSMKQIKGQDKFAALTYEDGDQKGNVIFNEDGSFSGTVKVAKGSASAQFEATYTFVNANGEALNGSLVKKGAVSIAQKK